MTQVIVTAPAKLNLALDVVGLLPNGYHELDMIMQAVALYERVTIKRADQIQLFCQNPIVPLNEKNTAYKAAALFFAHTGIKGGAHITIEKNIPIQAGMAGGSADAAAVLVGLNVLYGAALSLSQLCELGVQIGADVPFSLVGGTARVRGIGEKIEPLPTPNPSAWPIVVAMPGRGVSTPQAFARYDELGGGVHPDCAAMAYALRRGNMAQVCSLMGNSLQATGSAENTEDICAVLRSHGALAAMMTGSGAAVFGIFDGEQEAQQAQNQLAKEYRFAVVTHFINCGTKIAAIKE
ncbi:MAG: 4-(cytidine 5'-diphospho)-2-C-methyl-D-erythritol kinase [Oscillospiraceae bacterium]|nr:4-(cytidine 5'-diphospho)-2-C-methyl-D-erythritol kinase [Oscillospiraceae bacterium]